MMSTETQTDLDGVKLTQNTKRERLVSIIKESESQSVPSKTSLSEVVKPRKITATDPRQTPLAKPQTPPDKNTALKSFLNSYPDAQIYEDNNRILKQKGTEGAQYTKLVNEAKERISKLIIMQNLN